MNNKIRVREIMRIMGVRRTIALTLAFLLTVAATFIGGLLLYNAIKESIHLQGRVNVIQSPERSTTI